MWAGISLEVPTDIVIFEGIMDAHLYTEILRKALLTFVAKKFASTHRFMQVHIIRMYIHAYIST